MGKKKKKMAKNDKKKEDKANKDVKKVKAKVVKKNKETQKKEAKDAAKKLKKAKKKAEEAKKDSAALSKNCQCSGHKNPEGKGGKCEKSGWQFAWCYVSSKCNFPGAQVSKHGDQHKWVAGCKAD